MFALPHWFRPPSTFDWQLRDNVQASVSPLSGYTHTVELPGAVWVAKATWDVLEEDETWVIEQFIRGVRGRAGRFFFPVVHRPEPRGSARGAPVVLAAMQTGRSLVTTGWQPGSLALAAGDYFSFDAAEGRELKVATFDAVADANGTATLQFDPPIRRSPAMGAPIYARPATAQMRFNTNPVLMIQPPVLGSVTFDLIEAWGPVNIPVGAVRDHAGIPLLDTNGAVLVE